MQIAAKKGMTHDHSAPDQETKVFQLVVAFVETCRDVRGHCSKLFATLVIFHQTNRT